MNVSVTIRSAHITDIEAMTGLLHTLFTLEQDFSPDPAHQHTGLYRLLVSESAELFVAEIANRVVGMCSVQILVSTAEGGEVGLVEDVVVSGEYRGQGIGGVLLDHLEQWSKTRGLSRLQLLADRDNTPALDFYRRRGWAETRLVALRRMFP